MTDACSNLDIYVLTKRSLFSVDPVSRVSGSVFRKSPQLQLQVLFKNHWQCCWDRSVGAWPWDQSSADCFVLFREELKCDHSTFLTPDLISDFRVCTGPVPSAVVICEHGKALQINMRAATSLKSWSRVGRNTARLPLRRRSLSCCHATHDAVLQDDTPRSHIHMPSGPSCQLTEEAEKVNYKLKHGIKILKCAQKYYCSVIQGTSVLSAKSQSVKLEKPNSCLKTKINRGNWV